MEGVCIGKMQHWTTLGGGVLLACKQGALCQWPEKEGELAVRFQAFLTRASSLPFLPCHKSTPESVLTG